MVEKKDRNTGGLMGVVVGDALGLPVQFRSRKEVRCKPITGMTGYGTFNLPPGSWSDDSSLTLCLAESLALKGYDLEDIMNRFIAWYQDGYMTPFGYAYDIGRTTSDAIQLMIRTATPTVGGYKESDNGNGALMRILPAALFFENNPDMPARVGLISAMTHGHNRSRIACGFYSLVAAYLAQGMGAYSAYSNAVIGFQSYFSAKPKENEHFARILSGKIATIPDSKIKSSGYVIHTLEAALWCLLRNDNYADTVLAAVNLGEDTDTTAAVAGGLAGILYGRQGIPREWIDTLACKDMVCSVIQRFVEACC
jgi:ADP-ribosylglycohydrolase